MCCSGEAQATGVVGGPSAVPAGVRGELSGSGTRCGVCCWRLPSSSFGAGVWLCSWLSFLPMSFVGAVELAALLRNSRPAVFDHAACSKSRLAEVREADELESSCWSCGAT